MGLISGLLVWAFWLVAGCLMLVILAGFFFMVREIYLYNKRTGKSGIDIHRNRTACNECPDKKGL
jgi:hypothetical protein